jgi:F-type H+-transporting ATPase subunit delta
MTSENHELAAGTDVVSQRIARVYAEALMNAAQMQGDAVLEELESLVKDVFSAEPQLEAFLSSGAVGRDRKAQLIDRVFQQRSAEVVCNFLQILNRHDRLDLLRPIAAAAREINNERKNRVRVIVRSAVPLSEDQEQRLARQVSQALGQEPLLETGIDPELLGGVVVRVGDWLFDGSVRTKLDSIREQLIERSSYEIQSGRDRFRSANGD